MQLAFVLAKDYRRGGSSPGGSQWSFSSVDFEFRLLELQQKPLNNIFFRTCFYLGHVSGHVFQDLKSFLRLVNVLTGEFMLKNLCSIFKFFYRRVLKSFELFVFFQCCHNKKYSRYQYSFFVCSWFDCLFIFISLICGADS